MGARSIDVLLLAAHPPELAGLEDVLGVDMRAAVGGLGVAAHAVGIGIAASAAGAATALAKDKPRAVVLLGSYGYYPGASIEGVLQARAIARTALVDPALVSGQAVLPEPVPKSIAMHAGLTEALASVAGAAPITLATTLGITTDDGLAEQLAAGGSHDGENLEAYAVASACARFDVPMAALLVSTNAVGSEGRAQWLQHHAEAATLGTSLVMRWLRAGAHGL